MDGVWKFVVKYVAAPLIVLILGGLLLSRLQSPEAPSLQAKVTWIDLPNPIKALDLKPKSELAQAGQPGFVSDKLDALLDWVRHSDTVRVAVVEIENTRNLRSKEFEIYLPKSRGIILSDPTKTAKSTRIRAELNPLDPGAKVSVTALVDTWYASVPIVILHDGKRVHIAAHTADGGHEASIVDWFTTHPFFSTLALMACNLSVLFVLYSLTRYFIAGVSPKTSLALMSDSDLIKQARFVDWVRKNHPSKIGGHPSEDVSRSRQAAE
jgi:hypothetical protein